MLFYASKGETLTKEALSWAEDAAWLIGNTPNDVGMCVKGESWIVMHVKLNVFEVSLRHEGPSER